MKRDRLRRPTAGKKNAWNRTWKSSGRLLAEPVVVGVAVDIEAHGVQALERP